MTGPNWKYLLIGGIVAAALTMGVSQADACWGCGWSYPVSYGYTTCYTPACTVSCGSCYSGGGGWYVGYRPGPIRRLLLGPYRWYYSGYSYGSSYCWDTCCTVGATVAPSAPSQPVPTEAQKPVLGEEPAGPAAPPILAPDEPGPAADPPADTAPSTFNTRGNSGLLTIYVPYDAKIKVNGLTTTSEGSRRQYASFGLKPGYGYKYEIRAAVTRDGQTVEDVRTVKLTAGDHKVVTFGFNPTPSEAVASR